LASATAQGSAAANNGSTATATTDNSQANSNGIGSAAANGGGNATTDNSDRSDNRYAASNGIGSAAANGGDATSTYKVNNQYLTGSVTGNASVLPPNGSLYASIPVGNSIDQSIVGNAGITQTFQNSGNGLAQQSVLVDGTVTVGNGGSFAP